LSSTLCCFVSQTHNDSELFLTGDYEDYSSVYVQWALFGSTIMADNHRSLFGGILFPNHDRYDRNQVDLFVGMTVMGGSVFFEVGLCVGVTVMGGSVFFDVGWSGASMVGDGVYFVVGSILDVEVGGNVIMLIDVTVTT
jgi:hypothetical protein